jgi:hypothetical protein
MQITKARNKKGLLEYSLADQPKSTSKQKSRLEKYEQIDLNAHCKIQFPNEYPMMWHTVNEGGTGGAKYGAELKKYGRKSGVPDWIVMVPIGNHHGLYVELKRSFTKDSKPKKEQIEFLVSAENLGYCCIVAYGFRAALIAINDYLTGELN